jgi:hypothetical protein
VCVQLRAQCNTIVRLVVCGDLATATRHQQWYRTQMMDTLRRVETNAVQDEIWVRTRDGWKRGDTVAPVPTAFDKPRAWLKLRTC